MTIMPNLRSVIAQVHKNRNFSTSSPPDYDEALARVRTYKWMATRSVGVLIGYGCARYFYGDLVSAYEEFLLEDMRKKEEQREKFLSDIENS